MDDAVRRRLEYQISVRAAARQRQRGLTKADIELVMHYGEPVDEGFLLSERALAKARMEIKRMLQRLDHLAGLAVIEKDGTLVTAYRADRRRVRRLREGATERMPERLH